MQAMQLRRQDDSRSLEKVARGPFSDNGFVASRKRRDFCGLHMRDQRKSDRLPGIENK
jgi:hypothetical protein